MRKRIAVLLILNLTALSFLMVIESTHAQSIPSIPNFKIVAVGGYTVTPTTYTYDPFTGNNITNYGYTAYTFNITFIIQNTPPASAYKLEDAGHGELNNWVVLTEDYNVTTFATTGSQTNITIWGNTVSGPFGQSPANQISLYFGDHWGLTVPFGTQLDFRMQAVNVNYQQRGFGGTAVYGSVSDWSSIQTVTVNSPSVYSSLTPTLSTSPIVTSSPSPTHSSSPSPTPNESASTSPSPPPSVPEFPSWFALPLTIVMVLAAVFARKRKSQTPANNQLR